MEHRYTQPEGMSLLYIEELDKTYDYQYFQLLVKSFSKYLVNLKNNLLNVLILRNIDLDLFTLLDFVRNRIIGKELSFATNSHFLIPISLQPDGVNG